MLLVGAAKWFDDLRDHLETQTDTTVTQVATRASARTVLRTETPDCVITDYQLEESTGLALLADIRNRTETVPVVMVTDAGSETIASEALDAGVTDYIPVTEPTADTIRTITARIERAMCATQKRASDRERARQFDAIFDDTRTATWVLDTTGAVRRLNQTAQELLEDPVETVIGDAFWAVSWWANAETTQRDVKQLVENALEGRFGTAVVSQSAADTPQVVDISIRPVKNERDDLISLVVEAVDISERVALERDLRRSEELHRVTLNNMTDTILITDEDGRYTYVCPNVHFIFGYTAAEIHQMGTIDELLGSDVFDHEELEATGVLKNIECTATDKAGYEHTLLVNVRAVSIQDGRVLYSCRDITKRKQRENALATLQGTAREFLYAETPQEIVEQVVTDTPSVLDLEASAVYLFDTDTNDLRPAAHSAEMRAVNGPLPIVHADGETLPSYCFLEDESLFFDDVHTAERLENRATGLRSAAYIPLGSHGVFVAGSTDVGAFDDVTRELADLLAVTAEAALDRVRRESRLREQDRQLQQQNEQLTAVNRINETIRAIDQAIVQAETRREIDHAVCTHLTADDRFRFAWIGTVDSPGERLEARAWDGDEQGYLDTQSFPVTTEAVEPAGRTMASGEVTMIENVATSLRDEPWRKEALVRDYLSVLSIPLVYNDLTHGVLTVYAGTRDAFDTTTQAVITELGETIASALSAIDRKNALLTTAITRLELAIDDPTFVLSRLAETAGCTITYHGGVQQTDDGQYVFVTVESIAVSELEAVVANSVAIEELQRISGGEDGGVVRLRLTEPFLALELAEYGAVVREVTATPTETTLVVDVPESIDSRTIVQLLGETVANVTLRSKQTSDYANGYDVSTSVFEKLTERQLEVVQTAYYSGFFESPRESTGEDVAATLGISPTAFYQHIRTAQRKLFTTLFDERSLSVVALNEG